MEHVETAGNKDFLFFDAHRNMMDCLFKTNIVDLFISFACPKETNQRKGQPQIFFGSSILLAAHAIQLPLRYAQGQTVLLTSLPCRLASSLNLPTGQIFNARSPFAASKMSLFFQKRFGGTLKSTTKYNLCSVFSPPLGEILQSRRGGLVS
jgi:hypothetical protein